jgi:hypothetical protein
MARYAQTEGTKGSKRWVQLLVNDHRELLDGPLGKTLGTGSIAWRSPLRDDDFAEYRDIAALGLLDVQLTQRPLETFWPSRGPQWDALGVIGAGEPVLVEAKAHVGELLTSPSGATAEDSVAQITAAPDETAKALGATPGCAPEARGD